MKNALDALLRPLQRRFATLGLFGALALTVVWWLVVAQGIRLAFDWAFV